MAVSSHKYLIIGTGNAAGYAARQFVQLGHLKPNDLCMVGSERVLPYERPALSKAVLVKDSVRLPGFHTCVGSGGDRQTPDWYSENGIVTRLGATVTSFNAAKKTAVLQNGDTVSATHAVILATGAEPIRLTRTDGHHLTGIHYLRDYDDALSLYDALQANIGKNVIVVGGGYIGMEVTAAAVTVGCNVKMVFPEEHIMPRLFTPEIAEHYEKVYKEKGVILIKNGRLCKAFFGDDDGKVCGILTCQEGGQEIEEDGSLVVVGVGARATTSLFKDELEMDARGGVIVNGHMKTSADGVYAIGDIATFPLKMYGDREVRMEHVQNARDSATHAVNCIVNEDEGSNYDYLPYFYSRVFNLSWQFFGDNMGECIVVGDFQPKLLAIWVTDGIVKGVFMESPSAEETAKMKVLAREERSVDVQAFRECESVEQGWALLS